MKEDENCLTELDYFDMDRFSEWLVKKLKAEQHVPQGN